MGKTYLYNCTIAMNEGTYNYGGVFLHISHPNDFQNFIIRNCIIWGNATPGSCDQIGPDIRLHMMDIGAHETNTTASYVKGFICGDDPFVHEGVSYDEEGLFTVLYPGAEYDSLVVVVLQSPDLHFSGDAFVYPKSRSDLTVTGADSYVWSTGETTPTIVFQLDEDCKTSWSWRFSTFMGRSLRGSSPSTRVWGWMSGIIPLGFITSTSLI